MLQRSCCYLQLSDCLFTGHSRLSCSNGTSFGSYQVMDLLVHSKLFQLFLDLQPATVLPPHNAASQCSGQNLLRETLAFLRYAWPYLRLPSAGRLQRPATGAGTQVARRHPSTDSFAGR